MLDTKVRYDTSNLKKYQDAGCKKTNHFSALSRRYSRHFSFYAVKGHDKKKDKINFVHGD